MVCFPERMRPAARAMFSLVMLLAFLAVAWKAPALAQGRTADAIPITMSVEEAHRAAGEGKIVLIDIRRPGEWRETGLPASAYAITMHQAPASFLAGVERATAGDRSKPVAVICAVGHRSAYMSKWLRSRGYTNVIDVGAGVIGGARGKGWLGARLPLRDWQESQPKFSSSARTGG